MIVRMHNNIVSGRNEFTKAIRWYMSWVRWLTSNGSCRRPRVYGLSAPSLWWTALWTFPGTAWTCRSKWRSWSGSWRWWRNWWTTPTDWPPNSRVFLWYCLILCATPAEHKIKRHCIGGHDTRYLRVVSS